MERVRFKRPCKKCGKLFNPPGKYSKLCMQCNPNFTYYSPQYSNRRKSKLTIQ